MEKPKVIAFFSNFNFKKVRKVDEKLNKKIGLILEYYTNFYDVNAVQEIVQKIQDIYDHEEESSEKIKPLLKELYGKVIKNEFHCDLIVETLKEMEENK
jgi:hypothetical protein